MKYIDLNNWKRRHIYEFFRGFDNPLFNLTTNLDITPSYRLSKEKTFSLFRFIVFLVIKSLNDIPEFRYRLREDGVVEHDIIHPSYTVINEDNLFNFCNTVYHKDFAKFVQEVAKEEKASKKETKLLEQKFRDDQVYMSCIPWVAFTSIQHPVHNPNLDSVPRVAWGKFIFEKDNSIKMPVSLQAHHCLVDGYHAGDFFNKLQKYLNEPELFIS